MDGDIQLFTIQLANSISKIYTVLPHASTCLNRYCVWTCSEVVAHAARASMDLGDNDCVASLPGWIYPCMKPRKNLKKFC